MEKDIFMSIKFYMTPSSLLNPTTFPFAMTKKKNPKNFILLIGCHL